MQENLTDAFGSMYLEPAQASGEKIESKERRNRLSTGTPLLEARETLESISASAEDMLNDLTKPGFFSQVTVLEDDGKESVGRDGNAYTHTPSKVRIKSGPQVLMPGTLIAPSWESSIGGLPDVAKSSEGRKKTPHVAKSSLGVQTSFKMLEASEGDSAPSPLSQSESSPSSPPISTSQRPLRRSDTQEQRQLFLSSISQTSPASIYIHNKQDIDEVQASAKAAKLHTRVIKNDGSEEDVMIVIGSDLRAVEKLADELAKSTKGTAPTTNNTTNNFYITKTSTDGPSPGHSSTLKAVAGGAIVGAVGTWVGLAFS